MKADPKNTPGYWFKIAMAFYHAIPSPKRQEIAPDEQEFNALSTWTSADEWVAKIKSVLTVPEEPWSGLVFFRTREIGKEWGEWGCDDEVPQHIKYLNDDGELKYEAELHFTTSPASETTERDEAWLDAKLALIHKHFHERGKMLPEMEGHCLAMCTAIADLRSHIRQNADAILATQEADNPEPTTITDEEWVAGHAKRKESRAQEVENG